MLYHYALIPDIFRSELLIKRPSAQVVLKQLLRGLCDNGLIANLHTDAWVKHIDADLLPLMPPTVQDCVRSCLRTLKDRSRLITCAPTPYSPDVLTNHEDWLDAAVAVHNQTELQGIVLTQALMDRYGLANPAFVELSQVLDSPQWLARTHSLTVSMVQPDYEKALTPVLCYAKTISLIDPYMTCHERRFFDVVEMCARRLGKGRHRPDLSRIITIHSGDPWRVGNERHREAPADRLQA